MIELCLALLAFVVTTGEFVDPGDCPAVEQVSVTHLQREACAGRHCPVQAFYRYGHGRVLLDRSLALDNVWERSILVHELVHYLQEKAGITAEPGCRAAGLRELQAFRIQERYLLANGLRIPVSMNIRFYVCPEP